MQEDLQQSLYENALSLLDRANNLPITSMYKDGIVLRLVTALELCKQPIKDLNQFNRDMINIVSSCNSKIIDLEKRLENER